MSFSSRAGLGVWAVGIAWCGASALGCSAGAGDAGTTSGGSVSSAAGSGGAAAGTGGTLGGGGVIGGNGGSNVTGGSAGATTAGGSAGAGTGGGGAGGGAGGAGAGAGGGGGVLCPADATFCSSFEDSALPAKAVYKFNAAPGDWSRDFEVDTKVFHGGKSSLRVKSGSDDTGASGAYQMLAVPAPSGTFWVRLYIQQTELDIGGLEHNVFGGAADTDEPNSPVMIELAEDVGVAFNTNDAVRWPMNYGRINGSTMPFSLPKGMWHCIEINYDSQKREQKLFVNGMPQIDATDYPASVATPVKIFKFGFNKVHGPPRKVWFDDVAVGPTRAGCL
jgi:hypothetical protein